MDGTEIPGIVGQSSLAFSLLITGVKMELDARRVLPWKRGLKGRRRN